MVCKINDYLYKLSINICCTRERDVIMRILINVLLILALPLSCMMPQEEDEISGPPVYVNGVLACGVERWYVKTCIDADTVNVNFKNIVPS